MIFAILWGAIFLFIALFLLHSPMIRNSLKLLWRARRIRWCLTFSLGISAAIFVSYLLHPTQVDYKHDPRKIFEGYSAEILLRLDSLKTLEIDSTCDLSEPSPELAYITPLVINSYNQIVKQASTPVMINATDTLIIEMRGYKQFKNRSILLTRLLKKKLGNRYHVSIDLGDNTHRIKIIYKGTPWDTEQLCALPVLEASNKYNIDPALLMSIIRHVSNFNFNYKGLKDSKGILLGNGYGLEQIFWGAKKLSNLLRVGFSLENAIASFYPGYGINDKPEDWRTSPLAKGWVSQVMQDIDFYRNNGLKVLQP